MTSAGRDTMTARSTCGNGTRTTSATSKIVVRLIELVSPFRKCGIGIFQQIGKRCRFADPHLAVLDPVGERIARLEPKRRAHGPWHGRLRLGGDAADNHAPEVRNILTMCKQGGNSQAAAALSLYV